MRINPVILSLALLPALLVQHVLSEEKRFAEATETNQQLMDLYEKSGDLCLRNPSRDVQVAIACMSMTVYGLALNERG
jgi:Cu/Ag efflux pump CusA